MNYIEYTIFTDPVFPWQEIIMAELGQIGFESFVEQEKSMMAYVTQNNWQEDATAAILQKFSLDCQLTFTYALVPQQNWNEIWEKNFEPIVVQDICLVKASFHQIEKKYPYEILIEPKMSFGTGHHATTSLLLALILDYNFEGQTILDMGCGTGILGILALKKKAKKVVAIDIDQWSCENSQENAALNHFSKEQFIVQEGNASLLPNTESFDQIFANINRNVLLQDMAIYVDCLKENGQIYFSGFYTHDIATLETKAKSLGLQLIQKKEKDEWAALLFQKVKK